MNTLGFVALGMMGLPMAKNLKVKGEEPLLVFDRKPSACEKLKQTCDVICMKDREELIGSVDILFAALPTNEEVEILIQDIERVGKKGLLFVNFSSTSPEITRSANERLKKIGIGILDAPVSGGSWGAESASLSIMVGGSQEDYSKALPYLQRCGSNITYMGASGNGDITKIINNMIVGSSLSSLAEGLAFAEKVGIEPEKALQAMAGGFADSPVMQAKGMRMVDRNFDPVARVSVHLKDIKNALKLANSTGVKIPMTSQVERDMLDLLELGYLDEDQAAIIRVYRDRMDLEERRKQ